MEFLEQLLVEQHARVWRSLNGEFVDRPPLGIRGVLPGSFNPLHNGHVTLANIAAQKLNGQVAFELSVRNVEKPAIAAETILQRCNQFSAHSVVLTNQPRFAEKSAILPGCCFIVGADTAQRILQGRFYDSDGGLERALEMIRWNGCRFLVAARKLEDAVVTLDDISIPNGFDDLFDSIPESEFRLDISSSQLRGEL